PRTTGPSTGGDHTRHPPGCGGAAAAALVSRPTSNGDAARQTSRQTSASRRGGTRCMSAPVGRARHDTGKRRGSRHGAALDVTTGIVPAGYDTEKARATRGASANPAAFVRAEPAAELKDALGVDRTGATLGHADHVADG